MEKFNNNIENAIDSSSRFENLKRELLDYQLQYVDKLEGGELKPLHEKVDGIDESFKDYLYECTDIRSYLTDEYCKVIGNEMYHNENERDKFNNWFDSIFSEILKSHSADKMNYRKNINEIFKNGFSKLISIPESENKYLKIDEEQERAGLIHFNLIRAMEEFSSYGINKGDECISIHFKDLIDQKKKDSSINNIFSNDSLSVLSVKIIDEYPQTKAVIAQSWLVDSPIGKRLGFTPSKRINEVVQDTRFWGQFINENGEIDKLRINDFLKTGVPKYFITDGFIKTEDFLKKYLPKEKRGNLKLKELSEESKIFREEKENILGSIYFNFSKLSYYDIEKKLKDSIIGYFFKTNDGIEFLTYIKKAKDMNLENFGDLRDERLIELQQKTRIFFKQKENIYTEKEVYIG